LRSTRRLRRNDIRSRQHKQRETDRKQKGSAEADLIDQLETVQRQLDEEQSRFDVLSREAKGMQEELVRLRDGHKKLDEALKTAQSSAAAAKVAAPAAPVAAAAAPEAPRPVAAPPVPKDDELLKRVEGLDRQLREVRRKAAEQDEELKRARSKSSTATRMQLLTKNELDLFKEKMVWSEKRVVELERLLFENKIALPEREVAPQPKAPQLAPGILARESANTGGEGVVTVSADYVPEGPASETTPEGAPAPAVESAPAAPVEAAAAVLPPAPYEGVETEPKIDAVPPIRRPRSVVEGRADEVVAKAE